MNDSYLSTLHQSDYRGLVHKFPILIDGLQNLLRLGLLLGSSRHVEVYPNLFGFEV
jgi:hypothetical protein